MIQCCMAERKKEKKTLVGHRVDVTRDVLGMMLVATILFPGKYFFEVCGYAIYLATRHI